MDIDDFKNSVKRILDFIPQVGDTLWVRWSDDLPSEHTLLSVDGDYAVVSLGNKQRKVRIAQLDQLQPYVSDADFEMYWNYTLGMTQFLYHWFAENVGKVCLDGVTNGNDLAIDIKRARYEYHTGRNWSEFTGDKTK